ncbi:MAG TPA: LacI family DNA-binding transcriptional regulator [Candidatus Limnocylindria bacterium]
MTQRTTIADVAQAAAVHPSTVSRVLSGRPDASIRAQTRARVVAAAGRLAYRPSAIARSLRLRRTLTLGMLVPDIANPFFALIIKGAEAAARGRGYDLILCTTEDGREREATSIALLRDRQVDGVLIATARASDAMVADLRRDRFPFALVNRAARGGRDLAVVVDNRRAAGRAIAHLRSLGHRRIAHIAGPRSTTTGAERADGARAALRRTRCDADPALFVEAGAFSEAEGHRVARRLLLLDEPPTAIFGANDLITLGALRAARELELMVPRDLSLIGFNDIPLAELLEPALTTIRVPQLEMGATAARLLIDRLEGRHAGPARVVLPTELVVRSSTAAPAERVRRIA